MIRQVSAMILLTAVICGIAGTATGEGNDRTTTFAVDKMTCAACPITVKMAMERVDGVKTVEVDLQAKSATVTYDPSVVTPDAIGQTSTNAGYPAKPAG